MTSAKNLCRDIQFFQTIIRTTMFIRVYMGFTNRLKNAKEDWQVLIQRPCFKTSYSMTMDKSLCHSELPLTFLERKLMIVPL